MAMGVDIEEKQEQSFTGSLAGIMSVISLISSILCLIWSIYWSNSTKYGWGVASLFVLFYSFDYVTIITHLFLVCGLTLGYISLKRRRIYRGIIPVKFLALVSICFCLFVCIMSNLCVLCMLVYVTIHPIGPPS
ncbi:MAG: hypothetical protein JXD22_10625 [Sedimentisphaerales bacterium]|nr:hypothetical protein [Sedimentisphaerales bacterium]